jgi:hypothetical protein
VRLHEHSGEQPHSRPDGLWMRCRSVRLILAGSVLPRVPRWCDRADIATIARVLDAVTIETFAPRVGSVFRIVVDDKTTIEAELETVTTSEGESADHARAAGLREPFSIVLRGPAEPILPQRIYRLEHADLGALELFLVPIAQDASVTRYEAVFG